MRGRVDPARTAPARDPEACAQRPAHAAGAGARGARRGRRVRRLPGHDRQPEQLVRRRLGRDRRQRRGRGHLQRLEPAARQLRREVHQGDLHRHARLDGQALPQRLHGRHGARDLHRPQHHQGDRQPVRLQRLLRQHLGLRGTLAALGTTFAGGIALTDQGGSAVWDQNDAVTYKVRATLQNNPSAQGLSTGTHSFIWEGRNN